MSAIPHPVDLAILAVLVFLVAFMSSRMSTVLSFFGTIVILAGFVGRSVPPAAEGVPYVKETKG